MPAHEKIPTRQTVAHAVVVRAMKTADQHRSRTSLRLALGSIILFWLIYADGMSSASTDRSFCCFYLPKLVLVGTYVAVSAVMFVLHGRVPDRINMSDAYGVGGDPTQLALIVALCASVVGVGRRCHHHG